MGILEFILYMTITLTVGLVFICGIIVCNKTDELDEENRKLKEIITKNNYKI